MAENQNPQGQPVKTGQAQPVQPGQPAAQQQQEDPQAKRAAERAKIREDAPQDTSKIMPGEYAGDPSNIDGIRAATGTPPQVVEAAPGVEVDADLDRAAVKAANSGDLDEAGKDDLLTAARAKAPNLTDEFVQNYGLVEEDLKEIAQGSQPPPPAPGAIHNKDLYLTPGGWQVTPLGVPVEDVGKNQIGR